jgi:hypothetical protein
VVKPHNANKAHHKTFWFFVDAIKICVGGINCPLMKSKRLMPFMWPMQLGIMLTLIEIGFLENGVSCLARLVQNININIVLGVPPFGMLD